MGLGNYKIIKEFISGEEANKIVDWIGSINHNNSNPKKGDVYGFEASLYKHWTNEFKSGRVLLSFGFMVPYNCLNRDRNDPRVRLSQRIEKYFQSEINNKEESTKD